MPFRECKARDRVVRGGSWSIHGELIGVDKWTPSFRVGANYSFLFVVWIHLPHLPLTLWDRHTLTRIASSIGEPVNINRATLDMRRADYSRVCVRLYLSKKLHPFTEIRETTGTFLQPIQYEGIQLLCFHCGLIGHKAADCKSGACTGPSVPLPSVGVGTSYTAVVRAGPPYPSSACRRSSLDLLGGSKASPCRQGQGPCGFSA